MSDRNAMRISRALAAAEERRQQLRSAKGIAAIALWAAGCWLLYLGWRLAQSLPPPLGDGLSTAVYLVTFFYIFAFWPIHGLVERLFAGRAAAAIDENQKP